MTKGKIIDIREDGTAVIIAPANMRELTHRQVKEVYVDYIDSRALSGKQRRMCYSLINAISEWSGETQEGMKTALKLEFCQGHIEMLGDKIFSLSNAPMSLVAEFQRYLIDFIITYDIPLKFPLLDYVDDIEHYTYMCLINKKCVICGKRADLHHVNAVGMGNDRTKISHLGKEVLSLCREHHGEYHSVGKSEFLEKYHLNGGIPADKTICKIYGLRSK